MGQVIGGQFFVGQVKHAVNWEFFCGFNLVEDFGIAEETEYHTATVLLSEREGHNQINNLIQKFLQAFSISLNAVHDHPVSLWVERYKPDPMVTGQHKLDRRLINNPTRDELSEFIKDGRWVFYFKILEINANNASTVQYPIFQKPHPLNY